MIEIWKDVPGFEGLYQASNMGNIKNLFRLAKCGRGIGFMRVIPERILKPFYDKDGYTEISLWRDNEGVKFKVHRLIASMFISNPENKPTVNHINGIKNDNRIINLEWATRSENTIHAFKTGLFKTKKYRYGVAR